MKKNKLDNVRQTEISLYSFCDFLPFLCATMGKCCLLFPSTVCPKNLDNVSFVIVPKCLGSTLTCLFHFCRMETYVLSCSYTVMPYVVAEKKAKKVFCFSFFFIALLSKWF